MIGRAELPVLLLLAALPARAGDRADLATIHSSRTHHSDPDVYDHAVPADLMQASAILASFVYHAATRPEMLPRKPLPKPLPRPREAPILAGR